MQKNTIADIGRKFNSMKNKDLANELRQLIDGKIEDNDYNREVYKKLLKVIIGRLNTL